MPDDPSAPHPLEAALRAQAERRRGELDAGRPPTLPGPVRAALLRELERGATPAREERGRSAPWWWRWQTVLATAACVLLAVGIFRRETSPFTPAAEKSAAPLPPPPSTAADRREAPAPAEERRARELSPAPEPTTSRDADVAAVAPPPAPIIPPAGATGGTFAERPAPAGADEQSAAPSAPAIRLEQPKAPGQPIAAAPAPPTDALLGRAAKPAPAAASASQRFLQTPRQQTLRSAQSVGASPVLTDFTLRREGSTLVIRESDGSEYRASITAKREAGSTDAFKKDASRRGQAANRAEADDQAVTFRATGVNQTLKQTVVIEGTFRPAGAEEARDAAPAARPKAAAAPAPAKVKEAESRAAGPGRASVQGRAIISGREYAVEAEEAGPAPAAR